MREYLTFYIGGRWAAPAEPRTMDVVNPATEQVCGTVAVGSAADVDRAVAAAREAFAAWSATSSKDRIEVLQNVLDVYQKRSGDLAAALTEEMGAPAALAGGFQVGLGAGHLTTATGASGASAASTTTWRSRASSATRRTEEAGGRSPTSGSPTFPHGAAALRRKP